MRGVCLPRPRVVRSSLLSSRSSSTAHPSALLTACTTHHTNCRLSDGQPFHCLIVGYNTTRVVANVALRGMCWSLWCAWRDGVCCDAARCGATRAAADGAAPAELPGTLLRQGRQGWTPGVLARICHGSEMFVSTPYLTIMYTTHTHTHTLAHLRHTYNTHCTPHSISTSKLYQREDRNSS